uniref:Putative LOC101744060 [Bombyx mori] n=1 Tax=Lepeophtheirus salmonis TaxID=72036 RepID=A0A0K2UW66_LEPSM
MFKTVISCLPLFPVILSLRFPPPMNRPSSRILTGEETHNSHGQRAPAPEQQISSNIPWRLEIEEGSLLHGTPGQRVNIRIRLTNLESIQRYFTMAVEESGVGSYRFVESQSNSEILVPGGESKVFTLNLRVPENVGRGRRTLIRVTASVDDPNYLIRIASGGTETGVRTNFVRMKISFLGTNSFSDAQKPRIRSISQSSVEMQCSDIEECDSKTWKAIFLISDSESGIKSIQTDPYIDFISGSRRFVHNKYILGDPNEEVRIVMSGSCCEKELSVTVQDGFGNLESRSVLLEGDSSSNMGLNGTEISIIVVSILLLLVLVIALVVIIVIRRKRAANLQEIRRFSN